jgi:mRNA interferase MazF
LAAGLKRGDVVIVSAPGEYGKPRPSVIIQRNDLGVLDSIIVCPLSSRLVERGPIRPTIQPVDRNGLRKASQAKLDKIVAIQIRRVGQKVGEVSPLDMRRIERGLSIVLDLPGS